MSAYFRILSTLKGLLDQQARRRYGFLFFLSTISAGLEFGTAALLVLFVGSLSQPETALTSLKRMGVDMWMGQEKAILFIAACCGVIYLIKSVFVAGEIFFQNRTTQDATCTLKARLLTHYQHMDYLDFTSRNSNFRFSIYASDVDQTLMGCVQSLMNVMREGCVFLVLILFVFFQNITLALWVCVVLGVMVLVLKRTLLRRSYLWGKKIIDDGTLLNQRAFEFLHGFREVFLLNKAATFIERCNVLAFKRSRTEILRGTAQDLPRLLIESIFVGLVVFAVWFLYWTQGTLNNVFEVLGAYLYAGFRLMPSTTRILNYVQHFKSALPAMERLDQELKDQTPPIKKSLSPEGFSFDRELTLNRVNFSYPHTPEPALTDISFSLKKGTCLGIVGETGSGKSTLVNLILGLMEPSSGTISVDGEHTVTSPQWRTMLGYVPQSVYLIDDTIAANVAFGEKVIDRDRVHDVLSQAQLTPFLKKLDHGIDTLVGERGIRLSGGEQQRIAIARALYHDPEVLIFDEATSALDHRTEKRLMETIYQVGQGRTVIMIAHRLTTLSGCDQIVVMAGGRVKEVTTYEKVLSA